MSKNLENTQHTYVNNSWVRKSQEKLENFLNSIKKTIYQKLQNVAKAVV